MIHISYGVPEEKLLFRFELDFTYDIEIAYIDLVRSIEILANKNKSSINYEDSFLNGELLEIYEKIRDNERLASTFLKYHGSKKKFCKTIIELISSKDSFRKKTESNRNDRSIPFLESNDESIKKLLQSVYDIRSNYLHNGKSFGLEITPHHEGLNELVHGVSGTKNSKGIFTQTNKVIVHQKTPTFLGLERIVRQSLISYITQ